MTLWITDGQAAERWNSATTDTSETDVPKQPEARPSDGLGGKHETPLLLPNDTKMKILNVFNAIKAHNGDIIRWLIRRDLSKAIERVRHVLSVAAIYNGDAVEHLEAAERHMRYARHLMRSNADVSDPRRA